MGRHLGCPLNLMLQTLGHSRGGPACPPRTFSHFGGLGRAPKSHGQTPGSAPIVGLVLCANESWRPCQPCWYNGSFASSSFKKSTSRRTLGERCRRAAYTA